LSTLNQISNNKRTRKIKKNRATNLKNQPQIRGVVLRVRIQTPKKPNSARRPVCRVCLVNRRTVISHIPGGMHNLRKHSEVLLAGVGCKDLPGVNYTCVRGVYDFSGSMGKLKRRSIYGTKLPDTLKKKLRRKFRQL
jgi:small subunit ribosomal protein S12